MATPSAPRVDLELAQKIEVVVTEPSRTPPPAVATELDSSEKTPEPVATPVPPSVRPPAAAAALDDVAVADEIAVSFFSAPPVTQAVVAAEEVAAPDPTAERRRRASTETAVARRRALARYVTGAVAVCFMICAAAAVRAATVNRDEAAFQDRARPTYQATYQAAAVRPQPVEPVQGGSAPDEPKAPSAAAEIPPPAAEPSASPASPQAEPAGEAEPKAAAQGLDEKTPPAAPSADAVADAREGKRAAQRALDRGDAAKAVEAARRSVDADPSDAETWLILGAAYQLRGKFAEGREAFASCTKQATRGPKGECRALLR